MLCLLPEILNCKKQKIFEPRTLRHVHSNNVHFWPPLVYDKVVAHERWLSKGKINKMYSFFLAQTKMI